MRVSAIKPLLRNASPFGTPARPRISMNTPFKPLRRFLAAIALVGALAAHAETFTLTDKQGRTINADVLSVSGDQVRIKRDGSTFNVSLATLSAEDQKKLKAWAETQATLIPPGGLQVELSRGIFKTEKQTTDVVLVNGDTVKNGRTTTEDKWGYAITITNKTSRPLENLRAEYLLFATVDSVHVKEKQGLKKKNYRSAIETVPELGRVVFRTETISAFKMKYNGNIISAKSGDSSSREMLTGIWLRIYQGKELVYEAVMPESLRTTEKW